MVVSSGSRGERFAVVSAVERHQHRVAIGRRLRDEVGGRSAAGGWSIVDDDWLAQPVLELVADDSSEHVDRAARRRGDDELDRAVGPGLRERGAGAHPGES